MATSSALTPASTPALQTTPKDLLTLGVSVVRVATTVAADKVRGPGLQKQSDVPAHVRHITPRWLTTVLQTAMPGVAVDEVSVDGESSGTSVRGRLHLRYRTERDGQPATMFAKSTPTFTTRIANGLTGTASTPPRMTDPARGTVTGEALIFRGRDDSGSVESGGGRKTTTETTAPR